MTAETLSGAIAGLCSAGFLSSIVVFFVKRTINEHDRILRDLVETLTNLRVEFAKNDGIREELRKLNDEVIKLRSDVNNIIHRDLTEPFNK